MVQMQSSPTKKLLPCFSLLQSFFFTIALIMCNIYILFGVTAAILVWCANAASNISNSNIESILRGVKRGIVVKDGKMTSCEAAVIDVAAALASADCFGVNSNITGDDIYSHYELYLDNGLDGQSGIYKIRGHYVLSEYNIDNFILNYIYLKFQTSYGSGWNQKAAPVKDFDWDAVVYTRRTLLDMDNMIWGPIEYAVGNTGYDDDCLSMSAQFKANSSMYLCNNLTTPSPSRDLSTCPLPYGIVYGILGNDAYLLGIYSFTSIKSGTDLCKNDKQRSYYSALYTLINYLAFNQKVDVNLTLSRFSSVMTTPDQNYRLEATKMQTEESEIFNVRSDFYINQSTSITFSPEILSEAELLLSSDQDDLKILKSLDGLDDDDHSGGLSEKTNIIIGVCASIGGLFVICGIATGVWWRRKNKLSRPNASTRAQVEDVLESDLGGLTVPRSAPDNMSVELDVLPSYDGLTSQPSGSNPSHIKGSDPGVREKKLPGGFI